MQRFILHNRIDINLHIYIYTSILRHIYLYTYVCTYICNNFVDMMRTNIHTCTGRICSFNTYDTHIQTYICVYLNKCMYTLDIRNCRMHWQLNVDNYDSHSIPTELHIYHHGQQLLCFCIFLLLLWLLHLQLHLLAVLSFSLLTWVSFALKLTPF